MLAYIRMYFKIKVIQQISGKINDYSITGPGQSLSSSEKKVKISITYDNLSKFYLNVKDETKKQLEV